MDQRRAIVEAIYKLSKENPEQEFITHDQIVEETGLRFNIVDLCLGIMKGNGCVVGVRVFTGWIVALTGEVVLALEEARSQQIPNQNIGFGPNKGE